MLQPSTPETGTPPQRTRAADDRWASDDYHAPHPLVEMVRARLAEFFREPEAIFWVYGFPLLMSLALGIAFRSEPQAEYRVAVLAGPGAEVVERALTGSEGDASDPGRVGPPQPSGAREEAAPPVAAPAAVFQVELTDRAQAARLLRIGRVALVIEPVEVGPGASDVREPADATKPGAQSVDESAAASGFAGLEVTYRFDPTRPESVAARAAVDDALQRGAGRRDRLSTSIDQVTEPGGRYIDFLVPGLIGASLMGGGLWGVGFVTVDLRVRNLLKRFITTPMRKSHFLGGLMLSRFFFMVTEVLVLLVFARLVFGVVQVGSWLVLLAFVLLGAWTFAGIGLLVASRARTLETASGLMNLVMLPMYVASGIFFSADRFPDAAQPLIQALPLTALIDALRGVILEGSGFAALAGEGLILVAWSLVSFWLALRWFRWT